VCENHPISQWQAQKVIESNQGLRCKIFGDCQSALEWLQEEGYDINMTPEPFDHDWMKPSFEFDSILKGLGMNPSRFVTTF
jgi:hypothetical protein